MIEWSDNAIVLGHQKHGTGAALVHIHTLDHGRVVGYVHGVRSRENRSTWVTGNIITASWTGRHEAGLGRLSGCIEDIPSARFINDKERTAALASACALVLSGTPEGEPASALHESLSGFLRHDLPTPSWARSYIFWELAFIRERGFGISAQELHRAITAGDAPMALLDDLPHSMTPRDLDRGLAYTEALLIQGPLPMQRVPTIRKILAQLIHRHRTSTPSANAKSTGSTSHVS